MNSARRRFALPVAILAALVGGATATSFAGAPATVPQAEPFTLTPQQPHALPGTKAEVTFGVIPTRPLGSKPYYNPFTRMVEQRFVAPVPHPIPVLRGSHVRLYDRKPDLTKVGKDDVLTFASEVELQVDSAYALVGDADGHAALLALSDIAIPQDRPEQWRAAVRAETATLTDHIPDPVADRGRAVLSADSLPLAGRLVFGTRPQRGEPVKLLSVDLAAKGKDASAAEIAKLTEGRSAADGTLIDRVDLHTLKLTDKAGKPIGTISLKSEIGEFDLSADAKRIAVTTERMAKPKTENEFPRREVATLVFAADGAQVGEVIGYGDAAFLPDSRLVVTESGGFPGLHLADAGTGMVAPLKIVDGPDGEAGPFWPRQLAVSPDGKRVAYVSRRGAFVVGVDGRGWTPVWTTTTQEPQVRPAFSPDGRYVACVVVPLNVMSGPGQVVVFDLERHVRQPLPQTDGADSEVPLTWTR